MGWSFLCYPSYVLASGQARPRSGEAGSWASRRAERREQLQLRGQGPARPVAARRRPVPRGLSLPRRGPVTP